MVQSHSCCKFKKYQIKIFWSRTGAGIRTCSDESVKITNTDQIKNEEQDPKINNMDRNEN